MFIGGTETRQGRLQRYFSTVLGGIHHPTGGIPVLVNSIDVGTGKSQFGGVKTTHKPVFWVVGGFIPPWVPKSGSRFSET